MADKQKTKIFEGEVEVIDATIQKQGMSKTGRPYSKCLVTINTKNGPKEFTSWDKSCIALIGKRVNAKIFSTVSAYGTDQEISFEKSYGDNQSNTNASDLYEINKKLDRILMLLEDPGKTNTVTEEAPTEETIFDEELTF